MRRTILEKGVVVVEGFTVQTHNLNRCFDPWVSHSIISHWPGDFFQWHDYYKWKQSTSLFDPVLYVYTHTVRAGLSPIVPLLVLVLLFSFFFILRRLDSKRVLWRRTEPSFFGSYYPFECGWRRQQTVKRNNDRFGFCSWRLAKTNCFLRCFPIKTSSVDLFV